MATDWKDLFMDADVVYTSKINGKEIPWKKLTIEQDMALNRRHKNDLDMLEKQKLLMRLQNADNGVTETDLMKIPEDVYIKLILDISKQLMANKEDFQSGVSQKNPSQSTGSSNTEDIDSTKPDTSAS